MSLDDLPLRADLRGQTPYGAPQAALPVALNVNENTHPVPDEVAGDILDSVARALREINRYPDREFTALREGFAEYLGHGLGPEQIWAANGSNEVLQHVLQAFAGPGRTAFSFAPTYSMYPEYARDTSTAWVVGRRAEDFTLEPEHARAVIADHAPSVVLLASPNNPTGTALPLDTARAVLDAAARVPGGCVVVVDEAYGEFRRAGTPSALELLDAYPHLAVTRTMSKAFGLAGARVGYLTASRELVDALRVVRLPYHLSAVTQAVARAALAHAPELMAQVGSLRAERDALVTWLREHGFEAADSDANFVLFGRFDDREAVWQGLLERGVLVRVTGPEGWLRVSVGTPQETAAFKDALVEVAGR